MKQNSFVNKVTVERAILKMVNSFTKREGQLTGLSWIAIEDWQRCNAVQPESSIVIGLKELSDLCQRLSDRSQETFDPLDENVARQVMARLNDLSKTFAESFDV